MRMHMMAFSVMVAAAGCESEPRHVKGTASSTPAPAAAPAAVPAPPPPPTDNFIVGKTTTDIKSTTAPMPPNAQQASSKITARDPISLPGNAYVTIIGQTAKGQIKHSMDLYYTMNERYPKNLQEFMDEIIKPNGIRLPQLPFYQEYRYNEATHELEIWEDPVKKAGPAPQ